MSGERTIKHSDVHSETELSALHTVSCSVCHTHAHTHTLGDVQLRLVRSLYNQLITEKYFNKKNCLMNELISSLWMTGRLLEKRVGTNKVEKQTKACNRVPVKQREKS